MLSSLPPQVSAALASLSSLAAQLPQDSPILWGALGAGSATLAGLLGLGAYRLTRRFRTVDDLPQSYFQKQRRISGVVLRVGDADGFRLYHTPWFRGAPAPDETRTKAFFSENTLSVRLAGVDAPESGHFGGKPQPFSAEAKQYLSDLVLGKRVTVQIHQRDQYSRLVCSVWVRRFWFFPANVSLLMAQNGFATVYDRTGAVYGGLKDKLVNAEREARRKRLGMWSQDMSGYVSPMDYKAKARGEGG